MMQRLLHWYQTLISPLCQLLGAQCRFYPSCSAYAATAFAEYRGWHAWSLSMRRVLRCHPWHPGGLDPVPPARRNETCT